MKYFFLIHLLLTTFAGNSQKYRKIHKKAIVADTHNDVLGAAVMRGMHIEDDLTGKVHSDLKRFKDGGVDVQVFSVFCDATFGKDSAFKFANIEIDSLIAIAARNPDKLTLVKYPGEMMRTVRGNKIAALIGVEGGHMIEDNLLFLDSLFYRGARYLTLTWNNSTSWATSSFDESKDSIQRKGLNEFGKSVVKRMNALGMMVDVSHVGEQTLADILTITTRPVIASHSSVYAFNPHHRNLKDEQIKAIAKNGGIIQVNFYSGFLDSNFVKKIQAFNAKYKAETDSLLKLNFSGSAIDIFQKATHPDELKGIVPMMSVVLDHIDYIVKLVGVNHVGLGSDFDGISSTPYGLESVSDYPAITKGLLERGYRKKEIRRILGGNFIRVFKANMNRR